MRVHHSSRGGPAEYRESPILRCDERNCISLVMRKLSGRKMTCAAEMCRIDRPIRNSFDRFGQ